MLAIAAFIAVGTALELGLEGHWESPVQIVPFVFAGSCGAVAALGLAEPSGHVRGRRIVGGLSVIAAIFGIWEHLEHNAMFEAEIRPNADASTVWLAAISGGNPLLAPGVTAAMGLLVAASTFGQTPR